MAVNIDFKYGFSLLAIGVVVAGILPFAIGADVEPSMEIDMLSGQTQYPFRIQDVNNQNVFAITTQGGLDPIPVTTNNFTFDEALMDEIYPTWYSDSPNLLISATAEGGAGVYTIEHTITADDIANIVDSQGLFSKGEWTFFITAQLENIGAGSITSNWSIWLNDVELGQFNDATVSAGQFVKAQWSETGNFHDGIATYDFIEVGDTIGIKIWTNIANDLRLNHIHITGNPTLTVEAISFSMGDPHDEDVNNFAGVKACPFAPTVCDESLNAVAVGFWDSNEYVLAGEWSFVRGQKLVTTDFTQTHNGVVQDEIYWWASNGFWNTPNLGTVTNWK